MSDPTPEEIAALIEKLKRRRLVQLQHFGGTMDDSPNESRLVQTNRDDEECVQAATTLEFLQRRAETVEHELACFKALEAHLPEGFAIGDDVTTALAIKLVEAERELKACGEENTLLEEEADIAEHELERLRGEIDAAESRLAAVIKETGNG